MIRAESALDVWWQMAGIFSGGTLGLFLLGRMSRRATSVGAAIAVGLGVLVILWATFSPTEYWPARFDAFRNPLHNLLTIVVGTIVILIAGGALGMTSFRMTNDE
jgi:SSS family solute:Na+ symporter